MMYLCDKKQTGAQRLNWLNGELFNAWFESIQLLLDLLRTMNGEFFFFWFVSPQAPFAMAMRTSWGLIPNEFGLVGLWGR
jgi:hypothetical protein